MCGRYYLDTLPETLMEYFSITGVPSLEASYNIAPTQQAPIVRHIDQRELVHARWGLIPFWAKDPAIGNRMINARSETVAEKPAFRQAWKRRRCLVPASGFYEWRKTGGAKQPYAIRAAKAPLLAIAGLWERWQDPEGAEIVSYTLLTTAANRMMAPIHDRMPVVIPPEAFDHWLETDRPEELVDLLSGCDDATLSAYPVSTAVNKPANNYPELLERIDPGSTA